MTPIDVRSCLNRVAVIAAAICLGSPAAVAGPATGPAATRPADALVWHQPWHMVDLWWMFRAPVPHFRSLSVDVTLDRDVPSTTNLYVSPVGLGSFGEKHDFYGGLQTNANGWPDKADHHRDFVGHGAIFSEWGKDLSVDQAQGTDGTHYEAAGYEGDFLSVRHAVPWTKGTYTYAITVDKTETVGGQPYTWIGCRVHDHQTNQTQFVGALRFPGQDLTMTPQLANFVEIYSTAKIPVSPVPTVNVTFGYPVVNGACPPIKTVRVHHPWAKEASASPDLARVTVDGSSLRVAVVAEPFARDAKGRRYQLHPAAPTTRPNG